MRNDSNNNIGIDKSVYVHESSYVDEGVTIGAGTKIWHFSHIQTGACIGCNCSFGQNTNVSRNVLVGDGCRIQNNVSVYEGVELGDNVFCGPSCVFTNDLNPRVSFRKQPNDYVRTLVGDNVSIGANATIVCGITLGEWSFVAAGSVVTRSVAAHALVVGVPARQQGWVCRCANPLEDNLTCSKCGRRYKYSNVGIEEIKGDSV